MLEGFLEVNESNLGTRRWSLLVKGKFESSHRYCQRVARSADGLLAASTTIGRGISARWDGVGHHSERQPPSTSIIGTVSNLSGTLKNALCDVFCVYI